MLLFLLLFLSLKTTKVTILDHIWNKNPGMVDAQPIESYLLLKNPLFLKQIMLRQCHGEEECPLFFFYYYFHSNFLMIYGRQISVSL